MATAAAAAAFAAAAAICSTTTSPLSSSAAAFMLPSARALSTAAGAVPERMELSNSLRSSLPGLYSASLRPVAFGKDAVSEESLVKEADEAMLLKDAAVQQAGAYGSVAFVVRRPG